MLKRMWFSLILVVVSTTASWGKVLETEKLVWFFDDGTGYYHYDKNQKVWTSTLGQYQVHSLTELNRNDSYVTLEDSEKKFKVKLHSDHLEKMAEGQSQWGDSEKGQWDDRRVFFFENVAGYVIFQAGWVWKFVQVHQDRAGEIMSLIETKRTEDFIFMETPRRKETSFYLNDAGLYVTQDNRTSRLFGGKW